MGTVGLKRPNLRLAVDDCGFAVVQLADAASKAAVRAVELLKLAKATKRLGPLLDELQDSALEISVQQAGVKVLQAITAALQRCTAFATQCHTIGPVYALLNNVTLSQQLTSCSMDLSAAVSAQEATAFMASVGLQDDLEQVLKQLERQTRCQYYEQQHKLLFELHVQAEAVRTGQSDASILSAILTQQVLQGCTAAQLAADVTYLQQAAQTEAAAANHVGHAYYDKLALVCKALLPADGNMDTLVSWQQQLPAAAGQAAGTSTVPAAALITTLCAAVDIPATSSSSTVATAAGNTDSAGQTAINSSSSSNRADSSSNADSSSSSAIRPPVSRLQAALGLLAAVAEGFMSLPPDLATAAESHDALAVPTAEEVLQALSDPAIVAPCVNLLTIPAGTDSILLQQAVAHLLMGAVTQEPAVAAAITEATGCLNSLVRLLTVNNSSNSSNSCINEAGKTAVIQLLAAVSSADRAAANIIVQQKIITGLVQMLTEVKVVRGKAVSSIQLPPAAGALAVVPEAKRSVLHSVAAAAASKGNASRSSTQDSFRIAASGVKLLSGRTAISAKNAGSTASSAACAGPAQTCTSTVPPAQAGLMCAVLQLLTVLAADNWAEMEAVGVIPAVSSVLAATTASNSAEGPAAELLSAAMQLLVLLLQQDQSIAIEAMQHQMLPILAALDQQCCNRNDCDSSSNTNSTVLQQQLHTALILLLQPTVQTSYSAIDQTTTAAATAAKGPAVAVPFRAAAHTGSSNALQKRVGGTYRLPAAAVLAVRDLPNKAVGSTAAEQTAASKSTNCSVQDPADLLQAVQVRLGRNCSLASVQAGMHLLAQGYADLMLPLLNVLLAATSSREGRLAAYSHGGGMAGLMLLAVSQQPIEVSLSGGDSGNKLLACRQGADAMAVAASAANLLVQIGSEQQTRPALADPIADVLLNGSDVAKVSAGWLVSKLGWVPAEADKGSRQAACEFCTRLTAAGTLPVLLDMVHSGNRQCKQAGVAALCALAACEDSNLHISLLNGGIVSSMVDVVRNCQSDEGLTSAATAALGSLMAASAAQQHAEGAAADIGAAARAVLEQLVSCLQPSSPAAAASVAAALLEMTWVVPYASVWLTTSTDVLSALVKVLQHSISNDQLTIAQPAARLFAALLKVASSNSSSNSSNSSECNSTDLASNKSPSRISTRPVSYGSPMVHHSQAASQANICTGSKSSSPAVVSADGLAGCSSSTSIPARAVSELLAALHAADDDLRLVAAAALGHLMKRSSGGADRETVVNANALPDLLDILRSTAHSAAVTGSSSSSYWEDAAAGIAALGALNSTACFELVRALRPMLIRGSQCGVIAATAVAVKLAGSRRGRASMLSEGLLAGLVSVVGNAAGDANARAAAAAAIGALAVPAKVLLGDLNSLTDAGAKQFNSNPAKQRAANQLQPTSNSTTDAMTDSNAKVSPAGKRNGLQVEAAAGQKQQQQRQQVQSAAVGGPQTAIDPKLKAVNAGAVAALVALLQTAVAGEAAVAAAPTKGLAKAAVATQSKHGRLPGMDACVTEAADALYVLAGSQAGKDASVAAGATDVLQEAVLAGKRGEIGDRAAQAAYSALIRIM